MLIRAVLLFSAVFSAAAPWLRADDFAARCADRAAIERVYHSRRTGTKQTFEEAMPRTLLEQITRQELHKEEVLRRAYGVEITPAMVAAEVERINATTRAPEVLAEIKHALADDPARFATGLARPIVVERELRRRFENDDKLHAAQRRAAEQARESLLEKKTVAGMHEVTWSLTPRPAADKPVAPPAPAQARSGSSSYSNEATAQVAQAPDSPGKKKESGRETACFEDLDPELQQVLRAQLQRPGDVSAVVEMPAGFMVILAKEKTADSLAAAIVSVPKRGYEEWLAQQPNEKQ